MSMPVDLVLVRHGQLEENTANALSKKRDDWFFTTYCSSRYYSSWYLTRREQARTAGLWLQKQLETGFNRYYTPVRYRAFETAALLNLPNASWYTETWDAELLASLV